MSDLVEQMKVDALEAQRFSRKHLVLELDFSEASVDDIESTVDTVEYAIQGGKSEENLDILSRLWGAYIGEALRKVCGGEWEQAEGRLGLRTEAGIAHPQEQIRQRLTEGGQGLGDYFRLTKEQLS
ncbi:MAG: hypothetical protein CMJ64_25835 [Planctomycetaceae bacterium]|nr:hypothetical protein [Planctomycetaceae bacterium]